MILRYWAPRNHQYFLRNIDDSEGAAGECALYGKIMKFHENTGFSRKSTKSWEIAKTRDFGKSTKRWKWSPGGPPIKPGLINNQCVAQSSLWLAVMVSWHFEDLRPPRKWIKCIYFGGGRGDRNGPKSQNRKNVKKAENRWKSRFLVKKCIFWWISWNFTYFHEMCAPAPRPPENLARTMLFQWFWGVVFGPNPKSGSLLVISRTFPPFSWKIWKKQKNQENTVFSIFGRKVTPAGGVKTIACSYVFHAFLALAAFSSQNQLFSGSMHFFIFFMKITKNKHF